MKAKVKSAMMSREEFKELIKKLDQACETLQNCGDVYFDRKGVHVAAGEAVMWISATRAKALQLFEEQYPYVSRAEYYEITGREGGL